MPYESDKRAYNKADLLRKQCYGAQSCGACIVCVYKTCLLSESTYFCVIVRMVTSCQMHCRSYPADWQVTRVANKHKRVVEFRMDAFLRVATKV